MRPCAPWCLRLHGARSGASWDLCAHGVSGVCGLTFSSACDPTVACNPRRMTVALRAAHIRAIGHIPTLSARFVFQAPRRFDWHLRYCNRRDAAYVGAARASSSRMRHWACWRSWPHEHVQQPRGYILTSSSSHLSSIRLLSGRRAGGPGRP
eukprot:4103867-Pyramimonas_sp.AAC.1